MRSFIVLLLLASLAMLVQGSPVRVAASRRDVKVETSSTTTASKVEFEVEVAATQSEADVKVEAAVRRDMSYAPVVLANKDRFSVRQMAKISLQDLIIDFIDSECGILGPLCKVALEDHVADVIPAINVIESLKADGQANLTSGHANLDLLVHLIAFPPKKSIVNEVLNKFFDVEILPSTAVAYFSADAKYTTSYTAVNVDFKAQAFALFQSYHNVVEFNDTNSNKLYDAGEEIQIYDLGSVDWKATTYSTVAVGSHTVHQLTGSTADGVVNFDCDTSTFPVVDSFGQFVSPNATKCTITITNFPYKGKTSNLAVNANIALVGAKFAASASGRLTDFKLAVGSAPNGTAGGRFTWVPSVTVDGNSHAVAATGGAGVSTGVVDLTTKFVLSASEVLETNTDVRNLVFTFQTGTNPAKVVWDPTVMYGEEPVKAVPTAAPSSAAPAASAAASLSLLVALVVALLALLLN